MRFEFGAWRSEESEGGAVLESTSLKVPIDYDNHKSGWINLHIERRYVPGENFKRESHVILLAEDPGVAANNSDFIKGHWSVFSTALLERSVVYLASYRGTERSAPFPVISSFDQLADVKRASLPFAPTKLVLDSSVQDLLALISAIKHSRDWNAAYMQIVCVGSEYGSLVINNAVNLAPHEIQYAVLNGLHWSMASPSLEGMLMDCAKNLNCSEVLGGDPRVELQRLVESIIFDEANECVKSLNQKLLAPWEGNPELKFARIQLFFANLISSKDTILGSYYVRELALPVLKAIAECPDPEWFSEKFLKTLGELFAEKFHGTISPVLSPPKEGNLLVRLIVEHQLGIERRSPPLYDIHPFFAQGALEKATLLNYCDYLGIPKSPTPITFKPAISKLTQFVVLHNPMDLKAGETGSYDFFKKLAVYGKAWKIIDCYCGDISSCYAGIVRSILLPSSGIIDLARCQIKSFAYKWMFHGFPDIQELIWKTTAKLSRGLATHGEEIPRSEGEIYYKIPKNRPMTDEQDDYEATLATLKPQIAWTPNAEDLCADGICSSTKITLEVPSDYSKAETSPRLKLSAKQFAGSPRKSPPQNHIIFLAGGPGGWGTSYHDLIQILVSDPSFGAACYTINHRGQGEYNGFYNKEDKNFYVKMGEIIKNQPFPIEDLTLHNAALDVGMLALALRKAYGRTINLILYGFSHGARWGHQVIARLPNLFGHAILGGHPRDEGQRRDGMLGLYENCEMDDFCRNVVGGNVRKTMRDSIMKIIHRKFNVCTELFHQSLNNALEGLPEGERISRLADAFYALTLARGEHSATCLDPKVLSPQVLIPFLKATIDCTAPEDYQTLILDPIRGNWQREHDHDNVAGEEVNWFVNAVILNDIEPCPHDSTSTLTEGLEGNVHWEEASFPKELFNIKRELFPWLWNGRRSRIRPIRTTRTSLNMLASMMDFATPYYPAYETFQGDEARRKRWFLFFHEGHNGYYGKVIYSLLKEACGVALSELETPQCHLNKANIEHSLDWRFSSHPEIARMWRLVKGYGLIGKNNIPRRLAAPEVPAFEEVRGGSGLLLAKEARTTGLRVNGAERSHSAAAKHRNQKSGRGATYKRIDTKKARKSSELAEELPGASFVTEAQSSTGYASPESGPHSAGTSASAGSSAGAGSLSARSGGGAEGLGGATYGPGKGSNNSGDLPNSDKLDFDPKAEAQTAAQKLSMGLDHRQQALPKVSATAATKCRAPSNSATALEHPALLMALALILSLWPYIKHYLR